MTTHRFSILRTSEIAKDTVEVVFDISDSNFTFTAGSYVRVTLSELLYTDSKGPSRNFSIVSPPTNSSELVIAFRRTHSGFKRTLESLPVGTQASVEGPFTGLSLSQDTIRPIVMIAGGIGITPCMSMVQYIEALRTNHRVTLLYANSEPSRAAYFEQLKKIAQVNSDFNLIDHYGPIDVDVIKKNTKYLTLPLWYVVGSPRMVQATLALLNEIGIKNEDISTDEFSGYFEKNIKLHNNSSKRESDKKYYLDSIGNQANISEAILNALDQTALVAVTNIEGEITYANSKFLEVSQYTKDELLGQNHRMIKSGHHSSEFYRDLWLTISSGKIWHGEVKNRAKDGTYYWVDTVISPIVDSKGSISHYIAVRFPITERKEIESKLKVETQRQKDIFTETQKKNIELEKIQKELEKKVSELNKFQNLTVDREIKMIALKKENKILLEKLKGTTL